MREELLSLLNNEHFISGEVLARKLNVSRTAVWKQIRNLEDIGYKIESIKNKGYRLVSRPDKPIPEEIKPYLDTNFIGRKIHYFEKVNSTNNVAKELIKKNTAEGTVIISDIQTGGRGRKKRKWFSPKGGLWFSIILYPDIPPERGMIVTMLCSVAVAEALKEITRVNPVIKWPNDILINNKKVCGILTEIDAEMDVINHAIVGIGINVNNKIGSDLKNIAVSLKEIKNTEISRVNLFRNILKYLDKYYLKLQNKKYDEIRKKWFLYSNIIGKKIRVVEDNTIFQGKVNDVDRSGCLILDTKKGSVRIVSGDIKYL